MDKWVLDADIKGAFDNISHDFLIDKLGNIPGLELIKQWLKAGYVENVLVVKSICTTGKNFTNITSSR